MPKSARPRASAIQREIGQSRPFRSLSQEGTIALLRTASVVTRAFGRAIEHSGLSFAQYNALRIIRGAGPGGIPTLAVRERMIDEGTTVSRLVDKLEAAGLIERERSLPDRRQVICHATAAGKRLLGQLDPVVDALDDQVIGFLPPRKAEAFIQVLDEIRRHNAERGAPRSTPRARR